MRIEGVIPRGSFLINNLGTEDDITNVFFFPICSFYALTSFEKRVVGEGEHIGRRLFAAVLVIEFLHAYFAAQQYA